jgi:8-oxo-dGTP diphosphatase
MKIEPGPQVGVGVVVVRRGKVLLGKRKGAHGEGSWCFPGGHLEFNESPEDCARREVREEIGISLKQLRRGPFTNDIFEGERKHYVTLFMIAEYGSGEVKTMEPEKCDAWEWFAWSDLPQPLFLPIQNLLKENFCPF